jgi:hypothetical protein
MVFQILALMALAAKIQAAMLKGVPFGHMHAALAALHHALAGEFAAARAAALAALGEKMFGDTPDQISKCRENQQPDQPHGNSIGPRGPACARESGYRVQSARQREKPKGALSPCPARARLRTIAMAATDPMNRLKTCE